MSSRGTSSLADRGARPRRRLTLPFIPGLDVQMAEEEYLIRYSTACAKVGITPYRAYQSRESGGSFNVGICRNFDQDRLRDAYGRGREVNSN